MLATEVTSLIIEGCGLYDRGRVHLDTLSLLARGSAQGCSMEIDDELMDLMRRAEAIFGEAECSAAMERAIVRAHHSRLQAAGEGGAARGDAGSLPRGAVEAALKAELTRILRPQ